MTRKNKFKTYSIYIGLILISLFIGIIIGVNMFPKTEISTNNECTLISLISSSPTFSYTPYSTGGFVTSYMPEKNNIGDNADVCKTRYNEECYISGISYYGTNQISVGGTCYCFKKSK